MFLSEGPMYRTRKCGDFARISRASVARSLVLNFTNIKSQRPAFSCSSAYPYSARHT